MQITFPNVVTPCVGVWIETHNAMIKRTPFVVTPCVGVWIETLNFAFNVVEDVVTPCVGVWIETYKNISSVSPNMSHPAWVCGLKHLQRRIFGQSK